MNGQITVDDLDNLRHMLGVEKRTPRGYRNYFVAGVSDVPSMMRHPRAIDAFEAELRRAKTYLDDNSERPDRWVMVRLLRRVLKTGFAAIMEFDKAAGTDTPKPA